MIANNVNNKKYTFHFIFKKCESLFKNIQNNLISQEDYELLGKYNIEIATNGSEEQKHKYWNILKKVQENNFPGMPNYGILISLFDHFKSATSFPSEWYKLNGKNK
jgi:hypothetical protein